MKSIPYVFFDNRKSFQPWFLNILRIIPRSQDVYVLTNARQPSSFRNRKNIHFIELQELRYQSFYDDFQNVYVHLSTHEPHFELSCFERFFALRALMENWELDKVWHLDTDILPTQYLSEFDKYDHVFSSPYPDDSVVSAHTSKFNLLGIQSFTNYLIHEFYKVNLSELTTFYSKRIEQGLLGGVCDMQALAYWLRSSTAPEWLNSYCLWDGKPIINHTVSNIFDEFDLKSERKRILFTLWKGAIYGRLFGSRQKYATLHFQGQYKYLIRPFIKLHFLFGAPSLLLFQTKFYFKLSKLLNTLLRK